MLKMSIFFSGELGEYDPKEHTAGYISEFRFIPNQVRSVFLFIYLFFFFISISFIVIKIIQ